MQKDDIWLLGIFSIVCCVLSVWPRFTAKLLSYGKLSESAWQVDAFQLMGCGGLVVVVIGGALALFY